MRCTLLIPDLLAPVEVGSEVYADLRVPCIETALARGDIVQRAPVTREDWLCERFGVAAQSDRPLAPLMLKADGGVPGNNYWLCAEPVHIRVDRNRLVVAARISDYTAAESGALITALNEHFNRDGLEFCAPVPSRWYVRASTAPRLTTTALREALNRSVDPQLPQGADARAWHRVMNEAQMILHAHPLNAAREERAVVFANSIWLWGGGVMPSIANRPYAAVWGGDHVVHALATAAGIPHHPLPTEGTASLATTPDGDQLVVSEAAGDALREGDVVTWRNQLEAADVQWLQPLIAGVRDGKLPDLMIAACNRDQLLETTVTRAKLRRFWRRPRPLATYAAHA